MSATEQLAEILDMKLRAPVRWLIALIVCGAVGTAAVVTMAIDVRQMAATHCRIIASTGGAAKGVMNTHFGGWKWDSTEELALGVDLVDSPGAVRKLMALVKANTGTHDFVALAEDTDFFVHSESGNDFLVTITNQSANSAIGLVNHK